MEPTINDGKTARTRDRGFLGLGSINTQLPLGGIIALRVFYLLASKNSKLTWTEKHLPQI